MSDVFDIAGLPARYEEQQQVSGQNQELGKDAFLGLLTTQLQYQDPLDPMSNEDFIAQLAQFSSLEQLMGIQEAMGAVYAGIASMNNSSMANLLGTEVVAYGDAFAYPGTPEGGETPPFELHFESEAAYDAATVTIFNEAGSVVATANLPAGEAGEGSWTWDGLDSSGQPVPEGTYTFDVSATSDGESVDMETLVVGKISEMDYSQGVPMPSINGVPVGLDQILRLMDGGEPTP
jgi:flagellar basal-body rod modification protein FlgD